MFPTNTTRKFPAVSVRVIVAFFALLGTAIMYITRVNLNIAILSMAKSEVYVYNTSLHAKQLVTVGDFDWSPSQQGVILGSFFYGNSLQPSLSLLNFLSLFLLLSLSLSNA